jgi:hypothetical protein
LAEKILPLPPSRRQQITAPERQYDGGIAIFSAPSTAQEVVATFGQFADVFVEPSFDAAGIYVMQRPATSFWSAPSRFARRLARLVAIAAASLPDVGV